MRIYVDGEHETISKQRVTDRIGEVLGQRLESHGSGVAMICSGSAVPVTAKDRQCSESQ